MRLLMLALLSLLLPMPIALAEMTSSYTIPPKLTAAETQDAPALSESTVYPMWGQPCTNFTYRVHYSDSKGRTPEYVRINLNGQWHDMKKGSGSYSSGVLYTYNYIPKSGKSIFYYFEASNGVGKARAGIIDSPDQGPVLHADKFDNNQLALFSRQGAAPLWEYGLGKEMVSSVALSSDGKYAAAATPAAIYLLSADDGQLIWRFCKSCSEPLLPMPEYAGAAISADGSYIAATLKDTLYYFGRGNATPLWSASIESNAIGLAMSADGQRVAAGVGNAGARGDKIIFFDGSGNRLSEYRPLQPGYAQPGNFYRPSMTPDGRRVAASTGCPDRRAYLFSGDGALEFQSGMLTSDSPVHKSSISDDGSLAAFSADHISGREIVFLFDASGRKLWGFSSPSDATARAVSISANGNYVAAGTSAGNIYLFSKSSATPLWKFPSQGGYSQIGEVALSPDGSLLAAGGTAKKVHLFSKSGSTPLWSAQMDAWINALDFNGERILAGTGMLEYMFEGNSASQDEVSCQQVIQPPPIEATGLQPGPGNDSGHEGYAVCGNKICEPGAGEEWATCPSDCMEFDGGDGTGIADDLENGSNFRMPGDGEFPGMGNESGSGDADENAIINRYNLPAWPPANSAIILNGSMADVLNTSPPDAPAAAGGPAPLPTPQQAGKGILESLLEWLSRLFGG
ncbi:MAG: hypothetical protein WC717_02095 [Candidatus Micrarchaeia archaeon]|jgi:WD40 repeat protein